MHSYKMKITMKGFVDPQLQKKLKKLESILQSTEWRDGGIDKQDWYEREILRSDLNFDVSESGWIIVSCRDIDLGNLKIIEQVLNKQVQNIHWGDNSLTFSLHEKESKEYFEGTTTKRIRTVENRSDILKLPNPNRMEIKIQETRR